MVEVNPPNFLGAECYTFEDFRQTFGGVVCVEGVTAAGDLLVTAAGGASVNVNVAAGSAWVEGNLNGAAGMYYVENDASVAVTIAANGAGSSRIDLIIASVYDSQYVGAADSWAIEVVQGVAGAGVPAVPASTRSGYLILGRVTVPASGGTPSVVSNLSPTMVTCGTSYGAQPYVALAANAATSIPGTGTLTKVNLANTIHLDEDFFSVSSSVVTITQTGTYNFVGKSGWEGGGLGTSLRELAVGKNGTATKIASVFTSAGDLWYATAMDFSEPLSAGDTVQLLLKQSTGGALNSVDYGSLVIVKVG